MATGPLENETTKEGKPLEIIEMAPICLNTHTAVANSQSSPRTILIGFEEITQLAVSDQLPTSIVPPASWTQS